MGLPQPKLAKLIQFWCGLLVRMRRTPIIKNAAWFLTTTVYWYIHIFHQLLRARLLSSTGTGLDEILNLISWSICADYSLMHMTWIRRSQYNQAVDAAACKFKLMIRWPIATIIIDIINAMQCHVTSTWCWSWVMAYALHTIADLSKHDHRWIYRVRRVT